LIYTLNFFVSTETEGQPVLREEAHELTMTIINKNEKAAKILFFIVKDFSLNEKRPSLFYKNRTDLSKTRNFLSRKLLPLPA
jgi:hypothetical protein